MYDDISRADAQFAVLTVVPIFLVAFAAVGAIYGRQQAEQILVIRALAGRRWRRVRAAVFIARSLLMVVAPIVCLFAEIELLVAEVQRRVSTTSMWVAVASAGAVGLAAVATGVNDVMTETFRPAASGRARPAPGVLARGSRRRGPRSVAGHRARSTSPAARPVGRRQNSAR